MADAQPTLSSVVGRASIACAFAGFGVLHIAVGDFVTGRAPPWPQSVPGGVVWAWLTGLLLLGVAFGIVWGRRTGVPRLAAALAGAVLLVWAVSRNVPVTVASPLLSPQWTNAGKAVVLTCTALAVAGSLPAARLPGGIGAALDASTPFLRAGAIGLGLFMVLCGIQHFIYDGFVASLVPGWIPAPFFWTYLTGAALILLGTGLLLPRTAPTAAALSGAMISSWVWLVHAPRVASYGEWLPVFEALALGGLGLLLWRELPRVPVRTGPSGATARVDRPIDELNPTTGSTP